MLIVRTYKLITFNGSVVLLSFLLDGEYPLHLPPDVRGLHGCVLSVVYGKYPELTSIKMGIK